MTRNYGTVTETAGTSHGGRRSEVDTKLVLVREWLDANGLPGVAFTRPGPVAWLTAGLTNPIDRVPGRIPGALNAPWNEELPDLPDGELLAYCGSGVTACVVLHRLALAGREGKLYPGSWSEWEQLGLPVKTG